MKHDLFRRSFAFTQSLAALTLGATAALPLVATAQDGNADPYKIGLAIGYRADADIDDHGGDFSELRFAVTGTRMFRINERVKLEPIAAYRFSHYDFSMPDPWDDIHTMRGSVLVHYGINDQWSVFGGPSLAFSGEACADVGDAMTFGGALGVMYRWTERLVVGGGFTISSEIEDDTRAWPLVVLNWQITDQWSLESGYTEVAGCGGPGGEFRYRINDKWSVAGGAQYNEKRFRLSDDAPVREGVGEDSSYPIYAKVTWQVCPNGALELLGGIPVGGEVRLEDRNGHKISEQDYDPAPLVGFRAILNF